MSNKRSFFTKALAVMLTALMLVGSLSVGLVFPASVALAAESRSAALPMGNLKFIVPEAIYLYPNGSSWTTATASPFQYYINNDASNAPLTDAASVGKIYYEYAYTFDQQNYGAETAAISYQFVNSSFQTLSGGSVTLSGSTIASGGSVDITAGMSPSLGASVNGCYILWTLTFTDKADNKVKHAYALTYVYKPYVVPVGAMVRTLNKWGGAAYYSYAQQITWMSGMHSITPQTASTHDGNYYPNYSGDKGFSAFITAGDKAYVGGDEYTAAQALRQNEAWTASHADATRYNLAFLNTPTSTAHFNDTTGYDNAAATGWGATGSSASTFNVSSFDYFYHENGLTDHNSLTAVFATPYANIFIDTSRYSDLKQIPNLAVGLMATDNEDGDNGNWYVADYSEGSRQLAYNGTKTDSSSDSRSDYFKDYVYLIAGQGTNSWDNYGDYEAEGVKYAGAWPRALLNVPAADDADNSAKYYSTYNYAIKGMFSTEDPGNSSDYAFTHAMVQLSAKQYNKSTLRAAVQRAISEMASLGVTGISSGNITSCYFDANSNYKWTALQAAFKNAVIGLTTLNSDSNPNDLAKALNTALDELCTRVTVDPNGGSFQSLTTTEYVKIGDQIPTTNGFRYTPTYSGPSKEYYNFKGWSGNPDTHSGLSYVRVGYNGVAYATWEPVPYTMTLVPADDDNVNTETKTATFNIESTGTMAELFAAEGNDLTGYPAPRQGYSFWYWEVVEADEGSNWNVGEQFFTADRIEGRHGNVKLKAYWAEGMVDVNVYNYEMNVNGSYLNEKNRLVPADSYLTYGKTNNIVTITPQAREGFTVNQQKSRLTGTVAGNGSTILKVFYDRNQYNVTFVNYDGTELQTKSCYHGAAPVYTGSTPRRPAAEGITYTFAGWTDGTRIYTDKDEKGNLILPEIEEPTTFTAYYSETETLYNVTANAGEGTAINVAEGTYTYKTKISVSAEALAGYVADGLKLYANGVEIANPTAEFEVTEDVVFTTDALETVPSHIVSFYDAEESKLATVSVPEGGDATAAEGYVAASEREGYTFAQWSLPVNNVTEDMTVIAQYTKDGAVNYSYNFYNDATLLATLVREAGEEFTYPEEILGTPEKTSFDFIGWDPADFSPAAADTNVYAVFQPNGYVETHTLTVKYENGAADGSFTEETGTTIQLSYPERAGFVFTGWTGDTAGLNGERYTFQNADATITAAWYDLAELNAAEAAVDAILAESDSYHSTYTLRLKSLKAEKTDKIALVPASAADLDDLLARMNAAVADAPDWLLYTLTVTVNGRTADTVKDIAGATYTLPEASKTGYVFTGWKVTAGTVADGVYTFVSSNDEAVAQFTFDISVLEAEVNALSDDTYCHYYIDNLNGKLDALRTAMENEDDIDELVEDITAYLAEKANHTHKYTVDKGYDSENPPTCTEAGKKVFACVNCDDKTILKDADALGHDWGEWTVTKEATLDEDGEQTRTCARCNETETKTYSLYDGSDKVVKFVLMNDMYYTVYPSASSVKISKYTLYKWFSDKELRFKVSIGDGFGFPDYIVYINGEEAYPDTSGYYTVPASPNLSTVSIAGAIPNEDPITGGGDSTGKTNFWDWLVNLFRSIANFFRNMFNK
mgnify:CR=1 FL=1